MRLVYIETGKEVKIGDKVELGEYEKGKVSFFREPHKSSSSGNVTIDYDSFSREFYVGVIGAKWIEREDRE